jgi:hypothetical protein
MPTVQPTAAPSLKPTPAETPVQTEVPGRGSGGGTVPQAPVPAGGGGGGGTGCVEPFGQCGGALTPLSCVSSCTTSRLLCDSCVMTL